VANRHNEEDDRLNDESGAGRNRKWHLPIRPSTIIFLTQCVVLTHEVLDTLGR
jgi:hypothetical protein